MTIQSLSIAVPLRGCVNTCPFCVSRMHGNDYEHRINDQADNPWRPSYVEKMLFARKNGCNTAILTGTGEPLQNMKFVQAFLKWNREYLKSDRFLWIELQSTGVFLNKSVLHDLFLNGVTTISLSISDIFDDVNNQRLTKMPEKHAIKIEEICKLIKEVGLNLRVCINLTDVYNDRNVADIFKRARELGANQITIRKLYESGEDQQVDEWVRNFAALPSVYEECEKYVRKNGAPLERLPFGSVRYSVDEMSTVLDDNCMPHELTDSFRYLILRPDTKLYSRWDDKGSVLF